MLVYVTMIDKYRVIVSKCTTIVSAGYYQSAIIVLSNNKDKAVVKGYCLILCIERSGEVANGS